MLRCVSRRITAQHISIAVRLYRKAPHWFPWHYLWRVPGFLLSLQIRFGGSGIPCFILEDSESSV